VVPAVPGFTTEKRMETRFFVPGALVANLDFVESIFGNAGDPYLPENDAFPSSTVRRQKQRFSGGIPRNHAGCRPFSVKVV